MGKIIIENVSWISGNLLLESQPPNRGYGFFSDFLSSADAKAGKETIQMQATMENDEGQLLPVTITGYWTEKDGKKILVFEYKFQT